MSASRRAIDLIPPRLDVLLASDEAQWSSGSLWPTRHWGPLWNCGYAII